LVETGDRSRFGWAVGPHSWKALLHPASVVTMELTQAGRDQPVTVSVHGRPRKPLAFFGLRPCDLSAIDTLDHALISAPPSAEPTYLARRDDAFLVVVNCAVPAATCCCTSFGTGPHVDDRRRSHDIEIVELVGSDPAVEPDYVIRSVSERGAGVVQRVADQVSHGAASGAHVAAVAAQRATASAAIDRSLPTDRIREALADGHDLGRWEAVGDQCLACGNCTSVCPTCFCTAIEDVGDLSGTTVERHRQWESCFSLEFSRLGDRSVRASVGARYRQWMTHKLGTWHDQFGESGCVGCGRCTTWCPVGIDFVAVASSIVADVEAR
jgi:ferredoxin